jgi:HlyD family secretion protein
MSTPTRRVVDQPATPESVPDAATTEDPRWRRFLPMASAVLLLLVAVVGYRHYRSAAEDAARYVTAAADLGPIDQVVSATGTLNPVKTVQVGTYVSGPIIALDVDYNSPVKKDQRVAKIDPAQFTVKVREAEANLANAKAKVQKDRADLTLKKLLLDRNHTLLARNLIAQNDLDTARSNYDQAVAQLALDEAGIQQSQASLEEAMVNLRFTDILSPVDGVVVSRNVDVGQTVAASFQTPTLFLIAEDLTKMQVDANVSESDVGRVHEGQPATFTVDAYPGTPFRGMVAQVRNAPLTVQNVVTYDVVVAVDNANLELKPGMTANVTITTVHRDRVLRVPVRALRFRPEGGEGGGAGPKGRGSTVYVTQSDGPPRAITVKTGIRDNQYVEVLEGDLHEGDVIVVGVHREASETPTQPPKFAGRRF